MNSLLVRIGICVSFAGLCTYGNLALQNEEIQLKMRLPEVQKQIQLVQEENRRLRYEIEHFESPANLIEIAHHPEFSHLKHPLLKEILTVPEAYVSN